MRILLLTCLMMLVACVAPQNANNMKAAEPPPPMAAVNETVAPPQKVVVEDEKNSSKPGEVDFSCKSDSDCKIKDVGSCCGYRPACVNKDSKTFPAQVKAECAKNDMAGICGFPSISSCTCTNNKCEGVADGSAEGQVQ